MREALWLLHLYRQLRRRRPNRAEVLAGLLRAAPLEPRVDTSPTWTPVEAAVWELERAAVPVPEQEAIIRAVERALASMPARCRQVLAMRHLEARPWSPQEVQRELGLTAAEYRQLYEEGLARIEVEWRREKSPA